MCFYPYWLFLSLLVVLFKYHGHLITEFTEIIFLVCKKNSCIQKFCLPSEGGVRKERKPISPFVELSRVSVNTDYSLSEYGLCFKAKFTSGMLFGRVLKIA